MADKKNLTMMEDNSFSQDSLIRKKRGVFQDLSWPLLVIFCLGAVALSTVVGLIVHFAQPEKICICPNQQMQSSPEILAPIIPETVNPQQTSEEDLWELCLNVSESRNECFPCHITTEAPPAPTEPTIVNYRLPATWVPSHYDIDIRPHFYSDDPTAFWFEGTVSIDLECVEATSYIYVHTKNLTVNTVQVHDVGNDVDIDVREPSYYDEVTEMFRIKLARTLIVEEQVVVTMTFQGQLFRDMYGLYWSDYEEGGVTKYMVATQFQAPSARKAFPCLDEPGYKATFTVSLQHRSHTVALNNMPLNSQEPMEDDWVRSIFEKSTVKMSTYLQAFAISEFKSVENNANSNISLSDKLITYWAKPESVDANHLDWAQEISPPMFDFLENYFDHAFDLPKTDQIAIPDFSAGAMENWGLITYRESRLLVDPEYTTTSTIQRLTITIAHELLHMWLGNVVTCKWWSDLWLQEGMATFHQHEAVGYANENWDMDQLFATTVVYLSFDYDSTGASHPLTNYAVQSPADASGMFTRVTYEKGGAVIRMCRDFMGKDNFDTGMRNYIKKMEQGSAVEADLFASWEAEFTMTPSVGEVLRTWTNQIGYPLVTIKRSADGSQIEVTQKMYLQDPEAPVVDSKFPSRFGYKWHIPLTYVIRGNTDIQTDWLLRDDKNITLDTQLQEEDWILGNIGQLGFYRVNYDDVSWTALINQLQTDHEEIDYINRAQLIHDSFQLARSGELTQQTGLDVASYLKSEEEYVPFEALLSSATYVDGILTRYAQYSGYMTYIMDLVQPSYDRLGWDPVDGEPLMTTYHRNLVIDTMCSYNYADCVTNALGKFDQYMADPDNMQIIHPDHRPTVYCTAARTRGEDVWNQLLGLYLAEKDTDHEKPALRDALSCTNQPWLLSRLFMMALEEDSMSADRSAILTSIARNKNANSLVWENLNIMWNNIANRNTILSVVTEFYSTQEEYDKVLQFTTEKAADLQGAEEGILRTVRANMRWVDNNEQGVAEWLNTYQRRSLKG